MGRGIAPALLLCPFLWGLLKMPNVILSPIDVRRRLARASRSYRLIILDRTTSTNDVVARAGRKGLAAGLVVFAETQTLGRGQRGRTWLDQAGQNVLVSVLLRPSLPASAAFLATAVGACAVAATVESFGCDRVGVKWPNDIVVAGRKVAGVLAESSIVGDSLDYVVLGMGTHVNWSPGEVANGGLAATSVRESVGQPIPRAAFLARLLDELAARDTRLQSGDSGGAWQEWRDRLVDIGGRVAVSPADAPIWIGTVEDAGQDGALIVRGSDGIRHSIAFGMASVRPAAEFR